MASRQIPKEGTKQKDDRRTAVAHEFGCRYEFGYSCRISKSMEVEVIKHPQGGIHHVEDGSR